MPTVTRPLQVRCPTCNAPIGFECRTLAAREPMGNVYHLGRQRRAAGIEDRARARRRADARTFRPPGRRAR